MNTRTETISVAVKTHETGDPIWYTFINVTKRDARTLAIEAARSDGYTQVKVVQVRREF